MKKGILFLLIILVIGACKKDEIPTTGFIEGVVTDKSTGEQLADARIIVFDANTNAPVGESYVTDNNGGYEIELDPGTYLLKVYKLGYINIPRPGASAFPLTVNVEENTVADFQMSPSEVTDGGLISGRVESGDEAVAGVLVIAENTENAFSSVSDGKGNYYIYNVVPGEYELKGWLSGYNSNVATATVAANEDVIDINLQFTDDATATVSGTISFLATENTEVDVSLVHARTSETIPGLNTITSGGNYEITNVPDGTYLGRASYANDNNVMDPDWIVKQGEPFITVAGVDASLNFSVTNAVKLISPTNDSSSVFPVEIPVESAVFNWQPYPSANEYAIEVMDGSGNVIWGGLSEDMNTMYVSVPSSQTEVAFNFDNSATEALQAGEIYRWKIYATKLDKTSATGWRFISASEDQRGLIKIIE